MNELVALHRITWAVTPSRSTPTCAAISSSFAFKAIPADVPLLASAINYRVTGSYVNRSVRGPWAEWECMVTE